MSRSDDAGHYFQTTDSLASNERKAAKAKNKHGNPIKLPSKILSVCADPLDRNAVYITESAGEVKRVALETGEIKPLRPAIGAPLTSLTITPDTQQIYAGSWDKSIHPVALRSKPANQPTLTGHTDFVKCLLTTTLNNKPLLISGGADSNLIIWDLSTSKPLHKTPHPGAPQALAIDPETHDSSSDSLTLFTASNRPEIHRWQLSLSLSSSGSQPKLLPDPIVAHATSVYALHFDSSGDLWTASADKTAAHLVRDRNWEADTILPHPDFVRDVLVAEAAGVVVTACRDEEVRVWDLGTGEMICCYSGHFEEVTGLCLVDSGKAVVSVGIDGTVRRWGLGREEMRRWVEEREKEGDGVVEADGGAGEMKGGEGVLTAEEEAELAELMDED